MPTPDPTEFQRLAAEAVAHHTAGRLDAAEAAYRAALAMAPGHPSITHNLATIAAKRGNHRAAIALFDAVLGAEPFHVSAHYNRAAALQSAGMMRAAIDGYRQAARLEPAHYDAHRNLAFLYLAEGERGRSLDHFARTCELRRGDDHSAIANASLTHATRDKLIHDAAQFRYLAGRHRDARRFELLAKCYEDVARDFASEPSPLSPAQRDLIGADYNTAINVFGAAEIAGPAIDPTLDCGRIAADLASRDTAVIDSLLTPDAFARLHRFLLESTIWHDFSHIGGFVASYLEDGLASPLFLQIIDELRAALSPILASKPLVQAWAFKGL
ncbi:MAG: hypothetical protein RLZ98_2383, partial [Pseudomonadota bacterium]